MKVRNLLLLLSRHRITVTLFGVLFITVISSLVFVQNVFGQNPLIQMYETIQPLAVSTAGSDVTEKPSSDGKNLTDTIQESMPSETLAALITEPSALITEAPVTAQEPTVAVSAETTKNIPTAKPPKPASDAVMATGTMAQTIQGTEPATAVTEAAVATSAAAPEPAAEIPAGSYDSAMANAVLAVVNRVRSDNALPALVWNDSLASSAQIRAQEAVVCWDHSRPDGTDWWTAGDQLQMAENLGKEQSSAEGVVNDWMASPSHAANILNGSYTNMGVACYYCSGTYYWAQEFY